MKLLLVAPSADFSTADVYHGIRAGLKAEGVEIINYGLTRRLSAIYDALAPSAPDGKPDPLELCGLASEGIVQRAILADVDAIFFICGMGLHAASLYACRRIGLPVIGWFTEAPYTTECELGLARLCDVAFINERTSVGTFQEAMDAIGPGRAVAYLPHAYDPAVHQPQILDDAEDHCDALFIGTGFPTRQHLFESVDWTGIDLRIGGLWPGLAPPNRLAAHYLYPCIPNTATIRLYAGAKVVLNPHREAIGAYSTNPRTFEAAAVGAFQIADHRPEIAEIFGDSIPTYAPGVPWQLAALVRRFLGNDAERHARAAEARRLVASHTFTARAKAIIETLTYWQRHYARPAAVAI